MLPRLAMSVSTTTTTTVSEYRGPGRPPRVGPSKAPTMIAQRCSALRGSIRALIYDWTEEEMNDLILIIKKRNQIRGAQELINANAAATRNAWCFLLEDIVAFIYHWTLSRPICRTKLTHQLCNFLLNHICQACWPPLYATMRARDSLSHSSVASACSVELSTIDQRRTHVTSMRPFAHCASAIGPSTRLAFPIVKDARRTSHGSRIWSSLHIQQISGCACI